MMFKSILTVTAPAADRTLLAMSDLRAALGISDNSRDDDLSRLNASVSAAITQACKVRAGGAAIPTLREESLIETFRPEYAHGRFHHNLGNRPTTLVLARRPVSAIASVVELGVTLTADTDYLFDPSTGQVTRLSGGEEAPWLRGTIIVTYTAGWATVPDGLKSGAERLAREWWSQRSRDPLLRSVEIPGVSTRSFWIGSSSDPAIPADVLEEISAYRDVLV